MFETIKNDLLLELGLDNYNNPSLEALVKGESKYLKDLFQNVKRMERVKELSSKEQALIALTVANNANNQVLERAFAQKAKKEGATTPEIGEALACASLLSSSNVLYRFRHYMELESYNKMPAGMRMNVKNDPVMGVELFELWSTTISVINGCELCVKSHEASLRKLGASEQRVWAAVRLGGIVVGLGKVIY